MFAARFFSLTIAALSLILAGSGPLASGQDIAAAGAGASKPPATCKGSSRAG